MQKLNQVFQQVVQQVLQHRRHVKVIYENGDDDLLCNVLSFCFKKGRINEVYRLLSLCKNNHIDTAYSLDYAFSGNWAMWYSRIWFDLIEFVDWLRRHTIPLPKATVMMLCQEGAPQLPDEEMANNVLLIADQSMNFFLRVEIDNR